GLTLSEAQANNIRGFCDERISVHVQNYQDHAPSAPYDAIISIGAFEHFAKPDLPSSERIAGYREFFRRAHAWLVPHGKLSLQTITYGSGSRGTLPAFFKQEIFPESDLPTHWEIAAAVDGLF